MCRVLRARSIRAHGVAMTSMDVLVILLLCGLVLRFLPPFVKRKAVPVELPPAAGAPRSRPQEAAHLAAWPTHPFDRGRMVRMLLEGGHIDEARARELMGDA